MVTKLRVHNLKRFDEPEVGLGSPIVLIGPNSSGKNTAFQALALWDIGLKLWTEKRSGRTTPEKRPALLSIGEILLRRAFPALTCCGATMRWGSPTKATSLRPIGCQAKGPKLTARLPELLGCEGTTLVTARRYEYRRGSTLHPLKETVG